MIGSPEDPPFPISSASPSGPPPEVVPTDHHPAAFVGASPEDWEQVRRSIAMLRPGAWAMKREQALVALDSLVKTLRWRQEQPDP